MKILGGNTQIAKSLSLISPKLGLLQGLHRAHIQNSDPNVISYSTTTADARVFTDSFTHLAGGAGLGWKNAFLATVGEAVERYGSSFYQVDRMMNKAACEFNGGEIVPIDKYALFAPQQYEQDDFPFVPFTKDLPLHWDQAFDIVEQKQKYVPAIFLYMPFQADEKPIAEQISTGFAVHSDLQLATLSAIFEVAERDAFSISWLNMLELPKIRIEGELRELVNNIIPKHLEIHLLDMTTEVGVPSVVGILKGDQDFGDFIAVCACARYDLFSATEKTIIELCQSVPYARLLKEQDRKFDRYEEVQTFADHSLFYLYRRDLWPIFDKWLDAKPTISVKREKPVAPIEQINGLKKKFAQHDIPILLKDKTTNDLDEAGFRLVRAVCPGMIHLNGTYGNYYLGGKRLYSAPAAMGYDVRNTYETLNHLPHPFP